MASIKKLQTEVLSYNNSGELQNAYSPLLNFISEKSKIGDFTTTKLNFDRYSPIDIIVTDEYDGSLNIIINDDKNSPKLINNRISILENNTFSVPKHYGNKVTNVYEEDTLDKDTLLLKLYDNIPSLLFKGISSGGQLKCGSYIFYFKLADADGNLTNIVLESGIVQIHIGECYTSKIRMGLEDENSMKLIKFNLSNIDAGFDYVRIFYERSSTNASKALVKLYYMIDLNFPIFNRSCDITLSGTENTLLIDKSELYTEFADIATCKTQAIVDNTLLLGNISSYKLDYPLLLELAWKIIPSQVTINVGDILNRFYNLSDGGMYYNSDNVYYNVGYWPEEFYRFGIVFIYDNNLLSPVFNIQGCDLSKVNKLHPEYDFFNKIKTTISNNAGELLKGYHFNKYINDPEDGFFNTDIYSNSKGVIRFDKLLTVNVSNSVSTHTSLGIKFDLSFLKYKEFSVCLNTENDNVYDNNILNNSEILEEEVSESGMKALFTLLNNLHIKGFFFVRQKRIPTIIALGMVIGLTEKDYGSIPVIKNSISADFTTKSFLDLGTRQIKIEGSTVNVENGNVKAKALLVPDYDINESVLNQIFTSLEFLLERLYNNTITSVDDHYFVLTYNPINDTLETFINNVKLTAVPKNTNIKTDGENYFSTLVGSALEPYKTEDVKHRWRHTRPLHLTGSTTLIRGEWGSFVGMSYNSNLLYGDVVNIRPNNFKDELQYKIEFEIRFKDYSLYSAISPRYNISDLITINVDLNKTCYRGDCFCSVFTHRMMNNFLDPELPNNRKIVDPNTWVKNYVVRCTGYELNKGIPNLVGKPNGFYFPYTCKISGFSVFLAILFGAFNSFASIVVDPIPPYEHEVCEGFELKNDDEWTADNANDATDSKLSYFDSDNIRALSPNSSETDPAGKAIKNIFKADDGWELHGIALINRADVNAVSFGQWISFPICSAFNLSLRDIDFSNVVEETKLSRKRSFYPLEELDVYNHLPESGIINGACKVSISDLQRPAYRTIPFIKLEFFNRIYWSKPNITLTFINSYRMIFNNQYREYNKEYGAITKILPLAGNLFVVFQHGIGVLPVNRTPQTDAEKQPYLSSRSVLPEQIITISSDYGSMWKDSVIQTPNKVIYGVDTVAKKIWRYTDHWEEISKHRINKFLNEWIDLSEYDFNEYQGHINVKSHYNEFKHDVIFTYYKDIPMTYHKFDDDLNIVENLDEDGNYIWEEVDLSGNLILEDTVDPKLLIDKWEPGKTWSLCFNEELQLWTTFYDWYPVESCNVNNVFFSFDKEAIDNVYKNDHLKEYIDLNMLTNNMDKLLQNKVFLDKAFTSNTDIYYNSSKYIDVTLNIPDNTKYLTFYYQGDICPIIKKFE